MQLTSQRALWERLTTWSARVRATRIYSFHRLLLSAREPETQRQGVMVTPSHPVPNVLPLRSRATRAIFRLPSLRALMNK